MKIKRKRKAERLIEEFLADSEKFLESDKILELLDEYYDGFPLETLRPLLESDDILVRREAAWMAFELGEDAQSLIDDLIALLNDQGIKTRFWALGAIAKAAVDEHSERYVHVLRALESPEIELKLLAITLISTAGEEQLESSVKFFNEERPDHKRQREGIIVLLDGKFDERTARQMIDAGDPITRKFGAIIATKLSKEFPELFEYLLTSLDLDLKTYAQTKLEAKRKTEELFNTL